MSLTKEQVEHIAKLGRLAISEDEKDKFAKDLSQILDYVEKLQELDTKDVEPMTGAIEFKHVTRPDEMKKNITKEELLENAPDSEGSSIKVPKMSN